MRDILTRPQFNERIMNNDLLRHLARMQADPEASIRTNTCILIGRLGPSLGYNTKRKVLVPAFARALKDPFVHARVAGLMAFMATIDCFDIEDIASKVIPSMSFTLLDKEKYETSLSILRLTLTDRSISGWYVIKPSKPSSSSSRRSRNTPRRW